MATLATIKGEIRRLVADLPQTAYASAEGDAVTTRFPLPDENIIGRVNILPATTLLTAAQTITTGILNPYKAQVLYLVSSSASPAQAGNVILVGTDFEDQPLTETKALNSATAVATTALFKTVTSITLPVRVAAGETVTIWVPNSMACTVDATANTGWTMDFDSGWVDFTSAPGAGLEILWTYMYYQFNDKDILSSINAAVADVWAEVAQAKLDSATIVADSSTYEYALPTDCSRLVRVDSRSSDTSPYMQEHNWRVITNEGTRYLYLYTPSTGTTYRLHYVSEPTYFEEDTDTLASRNIPERGKWAVIYMGCYYLIQGKLLPRARTNQFKNAEGVNVPKIFEVQRIAADFRALAEIEMRKVRLGVKRWS